MDGDIAVLVDSLTLPTYTWMFRYHAGSSNPDKWEFMGGAPGMTEVNTSETTASATYAALTTAGPSFTIPRSGVYAVAIGCATGLSTLGEGRMSYDIGGTGAVDADSTIAASSSATNRYSVSAERPKTIAAAATALVAKYRVTTGTGTFLDRWMRVIPVRVS